jgi:hypothetical protein
VPTVAESGYANYEVEQWYGLFAPAKTPSETVFQLTDWFSTALRASDVKAKLLVQGLNPVGTCGADFRAYVRRQYEGYGPLIREANIRAERLAYKLLIPLGRMSGSGPARAKTFFLPQNLTKPGSIHGDTTV